MRLFNSLQYVRLAPETILRAKAFAEQVVGTTNYADSNQTNLQKILDDHFVSKLGEEAVRMIFEQFQMEIKGPDYSIYDQKYKSWDSDLYIDNQPLAVKTQKHSAARRYGLSWTFQCGSVRKDPILLRPEAWVCFVVYDDTTPLYRCKVYPPYQMKELTMGEPKLDYLKGTKKVVYATDLPIIPDLRKG